jgi:ferrous iron transport protein B
MPTYKMPQASIVARQVWSNAKQFVAKAGTTIFAMSVVLWALAYYPRLPQPQRDRITQNIDRDTNAAIQSLQQQAAAAGKVLRVVHQGEPIDPKLGEDVANFPDSDVEKANAVAAAQSEYSFAGRFGHKLEPVIKPLGYNWKMGVGLVAAFAAREVFVSTEGIVYATGGDTDSGTAPLQTAIQNDKRADGKPAWTPLVAVSLLIWFVLAMQCMSTVAIVKRETGGWGWPIFMIVYMNGLAYLVCLVVFQVGTHLFGG